MTGSKLFRRIFALKFKRTVGIQQVNFAKSKKIGLLVDMEIIRSEGLKQLTKLLSEEGKEIQTLLFRKKNEQPDIEIPHMEFTKKDVNWLGKFKKYDVKKFISTDFDYLFSLCSKSTLPIENILANCKAKCRIGLFNIPDKDIFDIVIVPANQHFNSHSASELLYYLKKINN